MPNIPAGNQQSPKNPRGFKLNGAVVCFWLMGIISLGVSVWMPINWYKSFPYEGFPFRALPHAFITALISAYCFVRGFMVGNNA